VGRSVSRQTDLSKTPTRDKVSLTEPESGGVMFDWAVVTPMISSKAMLIPGIPDEHLVRVHGNYGRGKGGELAYKHLPSGIMVSRVYSPDVSSWQLGEELLAELKEKLKRAGTIAAEPEGE
jgi:hypothetical protein